MKEPMMRVIELAQQAEGQTAPNPMVGCVVIKDGQIIAEGYHKGPGLWHAEREALLPMSKSDVEGADLYVNLEPCCHFGRTPPCTDIIIEKGIKRVFVGMLDPDPRMAGKGIEKLRAAGIDVVVGVLEKECQQLNRAYLLAREEKRPLFTLKAACSLDGYICSAFGESQWITNEESRKAGHQLRHIHDGILVGSGTVLADNPSLSTRNIENGNNAIPIILDSKLRTPKEAKLRTAGKKPIIFHSQQPQEQADADCINVSQMEKGLCLDSIASILVEKEIYSVLLEGGAGIHRSFLEKGWVDRIELFVAPILLGTGKKWLSCSPFHLNMAPNFELMSISSYKSDVHLRYEQRRDV